MADSTAGVDQPTPRPSVPRERSHIRRQHGVRYTDAEWAHIQAIARLCGKTRSEFIRDVSLRRRVRVKPFLANAKLVRELTKYGMAFVRLAATARESGALPVAADLETTLAELRALIRRIASTPDASTAQC